MPTETLTTWIVSKCRFLVAWPVPLWTLSDKGLTYIQEAFRSDRLYTLELRTSVSLSGWFLRFRVL